METLCELARARSQGVELGDPCAASERRVMTGLSLVRPSVHVVLSEEGNDDR